MMSLAGREARESRRGRIGLDRGLPRAADRKGRLPLAARRVGWLRLGMRRLPELIRRRIARLG